MDPAVIHTIQTVEALGQKQYDTFVQERLVMCTKPLTYTISKNNLPLFGTAPKKTQTKNQHHVASLKDWVSRCPDDKMAKL